jgi:hypothetical protein
LLAQFCANDPEYFLAAAKLVAPHVDGVDLNLGCPQRIARRGRYGAFLMDDIPLVEALVSKLAKVPPPSSPSTSARLLFFHFMRFCAYGHIHTLHAPLFIIRYCLL